MRVKAVGIAAAAALVVSLAVTTPAHADEYPTWGEVQAAQANAQAAQAEVDKITGLIATLQTQLNQTIADELRKAADYSIARAALDAATARERTLATQAQAAQQAASAAHTQFGRLASQLYVSGTGNLTARILLTKDKGANLLGQLGAVSQLTEHASRLEAAAVQKQNLADSLTKQAAAAEQARASLAAVAQTKLQAAQAAEASAQAQMTAQQQTRDTLYAQAAALKGTATSVQAQYYAGVAAMEQQARENSVSSSAGSGGGSDVNIGLGSGSGVTDDPAAAQAYAQSAIGAYGWGAGQFQCLVSLWNGESNWRTDAYNTSSGAYGIPQAWPAGKMATFGSDWRTNAQTQINWGLSYISDAYGSPCTAWNTWLSRSPHWY